MVLGDGDLMELALTEGEEGGFQNGVFPSHKKAHVHEGGGFFKTLKNGASGNEEDIVCAWHFRESAGFDP